MSIADKLVTIAENEQKVFDAGVQSEYDRFWDALQSNGNRKTYNGTFTVAWNDEIFKPKYDLIATDCSQMFQNSGVVDLKGCLEKQGVILDTSQSTMLLQMFQSSEVKYLPTIDASKSTNNSYAFACHYLISIEKLILSETTNYSTAMLSCSTLEHLIVDGIIDRSGFNVSKCTKLSHESLMSIINILKDYSTDTSTTRTCTLGEANLAKLTDAEKAIATEKGWTLA